MAEIKPAYLIAGDDEAKIARTRARLRARAEREGGPGALEVFEAGEGRPAPDAEALIASLAAISLIACAPLPARRRRRALGQGRHRAGRRGARGDCRRRPRSRWSPAASRRPRWRRRSRRRAARRSPSRRRGARAAEAARRRGAASSASTLDPDAAAAAGRAARPAARSASRTELERLALWAGEGGQVGLERPRGDDRRHLRGGDLVARRRVVEGDEADALRVAERLVAQGEALPRIDLLARPAAAPGAHAPRASSRPAARRRRSPRASRCTPTRRRCWSRKVKGRSPGRPRRGDPGARRPRALVARRLGLRRGRRADPGASQGGRRRRAPAARCVQRERSSCAAAQPRRRGPSCARRCCGAGRPSGRPCRSARPAPCARRRRRRRRPRRPRPRAAELRLHGAGEAQVLVPLALGAGDPLLL